MEMTEIGFQKLVPEDKQLFDRFYDKMDGNLPSTLFFLDMIAWNHNFTIYYKVINEFIVCIAEDMAEDRIVLLPFLGDYTQEKINETYKIVEALMEGWKLPFIMTYVTDWMKPYYEAIPGVSWEVKHDIGLSDYLYKAEDFIEAMNTQEARYNYRYFIRKYQPQTVLMTAEHLDVCVEFLEKTWCATHQCDECKYGCLKKTVAGVIPYLEQLDAHGIVVYAEGKSIAYSVVTSYNGQGLFEFKKTERGFRGINEFLHKESFERFLTEVKVINYSEDMGLEGMRKYKSRLAPYTFVSKYELRKR